MTSYVLYSFLFSFPLQVILTSLFAVLYSARVEEAGGGGESGLAAIPFFQSKEHEDSMGAPGKQAPSKSA